MDDISKNTETKYFHKEVDTEGYGKDNWVDCSGYTFGLSTWREMPIEVITTDLLGLEYKEPQLTDDVKEYLKSFVGHNEDTFKNFPVEWFNYIKELSMEDPPIKVIKSKEEVVERKEGNFQIKFN
tara:strand:- start:358 stop:732 length:375 start_codon:yes stop_codon:yes gene_type:complete